MLHNRPSRTASAVHWKTHVDVLSRQQRCRQSCYPGPPRVVLVRVLSHLDVAAARRRSSVMVVAVWKLNCWRNRSQDLGQTIPVVSGCLIVCPLHCGPATSPMTTLVCIRSQGIYTQWRNYYGFHGVARVASERGYGLSQCPSMYGARGTSPLNILKVFLPFANAAW